MNPLLISSRQMTKVLMLTLLCAQSLTPVMAFEGDNDLTRRTPVSEAVLDRMRGGFQINSTGPLLSFGIERSVFVNGQLVSSISLNIPDLMQFASNPSHSFTLTQIGGGNTVTPGASSLPPFMNIIQNSLDNQTLQSQTTINATAAALSWARALQLGNSLSQANVSAIRH